MHRGPITLKLFTKKKERDPRHYTLKQTAVAVISFSKQYLFIYLYIAVPIVFPVLSY